MNNFARFLVVLVFFGIGFAIISKSFKNISPNEVSESANIAVIEIEGVIEESLPVLEQIQAINDEPHYKAVIVRVNSPGGAVGASQEIYLELKKLRDRIPVIVSMGDLAASGGLYVSLGASKIVALPGTLTGSMGVLFYLTNFSRLMDKVMIDPMVIKSGELKDAGNPAKPMDPKAKKLFEDLVQNTFSTFKETVASERKLKPQAIQVMSDGRVLNGTQALEMGLVDQLGTFQDAVNLAKDLGKIKDKPELAFVSRKPKSWVERAFSSTISEGMNMARSMISPKANFDFRWMPSL